MKTAGRILEFYRELITECIPLFVAAGLMEVLCGVTLLADAFYLKEVSLGAVSDGNSDRSRI